MISENTKENHLNITKEKKEHSNRTLTEWKFFNFRSVATIET